MNSPHPVPQSATAPRRNWTRLLVNLLVALVVVAVAAATFVFSYSGVHATALLGGVSARLARYYPGLFDAVLVIACVAAVVLREGRWWARLWAWLVIVILLAGIGVTDVLHAMNYSLRPRPTEGIVAAAPVAAVLLAFSLLLTMLRQSRTRPAEPAGSREAAQEPVHATREIPALPASLTAAEPPTVETQALAPSPQLRPPAPPIALPAAFAPPPPVAGAAVSLPAPEAPPPAADTVPHIAPTREEPVFADSGAPAGPAPATAPIPATQAPTAPAVPPVAAVQEPAQPTVQEPVQPEAAIEDASEESRTEESRTATAEPPTVPVPVRTPQGIRYAGAAARSAGKPETAQPGISEPRTVPEATEPTATQPEATQPEPAEPTAAEPASAEPARAERADYWDGEEASPFAGLVYPARDNGPDSGDNRHADDNGRAGDSASDEPPARRLPPELDDDAPPFATAPFAPVPRLNRVRSMPAPPSDDED